MYKLFMKHMPILMIFFVMYFAFGVMNPLKVAYANNIAMSYLNVFILTIHIYFMEAILFIRDLF